MSTFFERRTRKYLQKKYQKFNPARMIAKSFGIIILIGTLLLMLPMSARNGQSTDLLTSLFTATSATCVTGLVTVDTWSHWSALGQGIILAMIQMGGLGFMTIITMISIVMHRRIGLSERLIMVSALNLSDIDGVVRVVRHALIGTFLFEGIGAVILSACFIPQYGWASGIWKGVFHSVSAFCNAGFDIMGNNGPFTGMSNYASHPVVLFTLMALVVIGGLGFFVWEDIMSAKNWKGLSLYSKMVLGITGTLILGGWIFFALSEWTNPATLGVMSSGDKVVNALFQSITLRTAGFNTIDQGALREGAIIICCVFMLIGGSSGSTAGGLKTATAGVLFLTLRAGMRGQEEVTFRGRSISQRRVMSALTLTLMVACMFLVGSVAITIMEGIPYLVAAFETASALATVGLSANLTTHLSVASRILVICMMFVGRVGIISFSVAFVARNKGLTKIKYPKCNIMIG